jgi:hypothetical protein
MLVGIAVGVGALSIMSVEPGTGGEKVEGPRTVFHFDAIFDVVTSVFSKPDACDGGVSLAECEVRDDDRE